MDIGPVGQPGLAAERGAERLVEPQAWWTLAPIAGFSSGWTSMVPAVALPVLDQMPERLALASLAMLSVCISAWFWVEPRLAG